MARNYFVKFFQWYQVASGGVMPGQNGRKWVWYYLVLYGVGESFGRWQVAARNKARDFFKGLF